MSTLWNWKADQQMDSVYMFSKLQTVTREKGLCQLRAKSGDEDEQESSRTGHSRAGMPA